MQQTQQEIKIIKDMIAKTRRETAESGNFFVAIGIFSMLMILMIGLLQKAHSSRWIIPALLVMVLGNMLIGFLFVKKATEKKGVWSYPKKICASIWIACGIPSLILIFVFPVYAIYPWSLVVVLTPLLMGMAVFACGVILESNLLAGSAFFWWIGGSAMAFIHGNMRLWVMMFIVLCGWILPGFALNRQVKKMRNTNES